MYPYVQILVERHCRDMYGHYGKRQSDSEEIKTLP